VIRVRGLEKTYGDVRAVDGVDFEIEGHEVVGFLGPNGAGKSTTMRILAGFLHADGGSATVAGRTVDPDDPRSRAAVGYLPESTPLYRRMRVLPYLDFVGRLRGLGRRERRTAVGRVVERCDLHGYETRRIGHLSKGYRQRVGLAQALLADPEVLILDEPTSGLDPGEIARIRQLVQELGETKTVLLSTHVLPEVQETCRRVIILGRGRVVADGDTRELAGSGEVELRVTAEAPVEELFRALAELPEVKRARPHGVPSEARSGAVLVVDDRYAAAAAVHRTLVARGWTLLELRHDLPDLERVFLRVTAGEDPGEVAP